MIETLLQAILEQVDQPKKDIEHNLRALLNEAISKMDIVSKDEIERQKTALNNANLRLTDLQEQVKALEVLIQDKNKLNLHIIGAKNIIMIKNKAKVENNNVFSQNLYPRFARAACTFN